MIGIKAEILDTLYPSPKFLTVSSGTLPGSQ
jgi:hypothetical protein